MDDPLSSLGLTAVALYRAHSTNVNVLIKRPYKNTLAYQSVTIASYQRIKRLSQSGFTEVVQVPHTGQEAYFLFYWQKHYPLECQSSLVMNPRPDPNTTYLTSDDAHPTIRSSRARFGT